MKFNENDTTANYSYSKTQVYEDEPMRKKAKPLAEFCDYNGRGRNKNSRALRHLVVIDNSVDFNRG